MSGWLSGATERDSPKKITSATGSAYYVTGSHALKFGMTALRQWTQINQKSDSKWTSILVSGGSPITAQFWGSSEETESAVTLGLYAQDQWRVGRMTVNAGVRFDNARAGYPDQVRPASTWVPQAFSITGQTVVNWKDLQPRLGVAYDLSGDGKTALKAYANRYGARESTTRAAGANPAITNRSMNRVWSDSTCISGTCIPGDGIPQGDPLNFAPNGELISSNTNLAFGVPAQTVFYDPAWAFGWGNRQSQWEFSGSVQREVRPGFSVDFSYFNRRHIDLDANDDRNLGPADFDKFTVLVPGDPRLPSSIRNTPITLVNLKPTSIRTPDLVTTSANNFGGRTRSWNGLDVTADGRLRKLLLQGGVSSGKFSSDTCDVFAAVPEMNAVQALPATAQLLPLEYCKTTQNWLTYVKLIGSYTLPYDVQVAGTLQNQPGPSRQARVTYSTAAITAALGRPAPRRRSTWFRRVRSSASGSASWTCGSRRCSSSSGAGSSARCSTSSTCSTRTRRPLRSRDSARPICSRR